MRAVVVVASLALGLCGGEPCGGLECGPCPPPLQVRVTRADGGLLAPVMIDGADALCAGGGTEAVCTVETLALGIHELTVRSDGEAPVTLTVVLEHDGARCCSCGYAAVTRDVVLGAPPDGGV